jgi:hypothetical protein
MIESDVLQHKGTLGEPQRLRHFVDEDSFGKAGRFVLIAQSAD